MADALTEALIYGGIPAAFAWLWDMTRNGGNGTVGVIKSTGDSAVNVIHAMIDTLAKIRVALKSGASWEVQREGLISNHVTAGVPHDTAAQAVDTLHKLFLPSRMAALIADQAVAEIGSLNEVGQRSASATLPMLTDLLNQMEYYQRTQGPLAVNNYLLQGDLTLLLGSNNTMSPARLSTMSPWTLGSKTAEALLKKFPAMSTNETLTLEDNKYTYALPASVYQMLNNTGEWAYNVTRDVGASISGMGTLLRDVPGYLRWVATIAAVMGAVAVPTYLYWKCRETKKTDDSQQKTAELLRELYKVKTEAEKAVLEVIKEVQKSNANTQKELVGVLQKSSSKSPRVDDEEVTRPTQLLSRGKRLWEIEDEEMIPLLVDAFVTLAVSRALLFEIPQDPPQSIWTYVKSFVVNVTEPGFLTRMVCMEPEDADKLNPISRSFWSHYSNNWSKEEQRRYTPLLKLKDLHVSAALKVKTVLDNSDDHDPKSLLGYIAKHRHQIKSEGLYQTLARFPLLLLEYFGDNLKTLESDIRERDRAIQDKKPITEKPGIDEKVWGDPTIDLLFLLDDSWMDAGQIGRLLDRETPMTRDQLYWLSKHPRVLQDHLFRNRMKDGIQSRVEVKTRNATIVVFKPWMENDSIWDIMENKVDKIMKDEKPTIAHLRAAFLIAAADLENQIMEEHFEWKDGPFKRMAQPIHEARWRGNARGDPMIMPRSTMQAPWFTEVSWFSSLATCSETRDMVQMMLKNPKNFPMFSDMKDGKEGDKVHALLNKKHVTITFAKNLVALQVHDMMKSMGQYSFAREHGLDCFVCGQFRINGFAALVHYGQSKALHAYKEYATDAALSRVILSMGEAHRYGYAINVEKSFLRIDPGTNRVFVELWGVSQTGNAYTDFQKLLKVWTNPESGLVKILKTRDNVLESVKGCQFSSPYEKREGLTKMGPWLQALKHMHDNGYYGFITPKLLQSQRYYENKTPQDNGIPANIDHRGLIDDKKWSKIQDCQMLLKSMMLLPKFIEYGTWDDHLPIWQDDIPMRGLADAKLTIDMLIESRMQSLLFQDHLPYLRLYTGALPVRESLFSYSFNGKKKWIYDIKKQKLYEEIDKKLVNEMSIAAIRVKK